MLNLYKEKAQCCGCGICSFVCPQHAISMQADAMGFVYPVINQTLCIDCSACAKNCSYGKEIIPDTLACYAGMNTNDAQLQHSASGGIFSAIASEFLQDGLLCGATMTLDNGIAIVRHEFGSDIRKFQGSKYVQSDLLPCLDAIGNALRSGKKVLFCGTPCQVHAVRSLFRNHLDRLFAIDIICHGVPNQQFFNDYLSLYQKENKFQLVHFDFRNKQYGWGLKGKATDSYGKHHVITPVNCSYYKYFLEGEIYRDSCYNCPYACMQRPGDLTIGDYWGIEKYNSELLAKNGGEFSAKKGVSCLLVNNSRGEELLRKYGRHILTAPVDIQNILIINTQLREPAQHSPKRSKIFNAYQQNGYAGVQRIFRREMGIKKVRKLVKCITPLPIRNAIKNMRKT